MSSPFAKQDDSDLMVGGADANADKVKAEACQLPAAAILVQEIKEVNVCGTLSLGIPVDLVILSASLPNAEYQVKGNFIRCKLNWKKTLGLTAFVFKTGKVTFMGAADEDSARRAGAEIVRLVQEIGYADARVCGFRVTNRVGKLKLPYSLDLNLLCDLLTSQQGGPKPVKNDDGQLGSLNFEPELFPGLCQQVYVDKWLTATLYHSGSIVLTGAQKTGQFSRCIEWLYPFLSKSCRVPSTPRIERGNRRRGTR